MFSSSIARLCFVCLLAFGVVQCGLSVDEKPAQDRDVEVGQQVGCLSDIGQISIDFIEARLKDKKLRRTLDCVTFSIEAFENYTEGEDKFTYKPTEVRDFLQRFFLNRNEKRQDLKLSDEFLEELMHLKAMIVGGSPELITRPELRRLAESSKKIKRALMTLNPVMSVVNWALLSRTKIGHEQTGVKAVAGQIALIKMSEILVDALPSEDVVDPDYRYDLDRVV
ncbi:MAG: hypothetical protein AAF202_00880, partial [Pseudomonadota bacterium]